MELEEQQNCSSYTEFYLNVLFPSAIMFGMTSEQFWEDDPQLYWSYQIFYKRKLELEQQQTLEYIKYSSWLNGNMNFTAHSLSLANSLGKGKKNEFPDYNKIFKENEKKEEKQKLLTKQEINIKVQEEFNAWARY